MFLCLQNETQETPERGERGGASSTRHRPGPQSSTNRESDDRRGKHPTNEREWKAEPEQSRQKRRDEGEVRRGGGRDERPQRSTRDREQTARDTNRDQTQREYHGYRGSERRETQKDNRKNTPRDVRTPRDVKPRDRRTDTRDDEELSGSRSQRESKPRDRRSNTQDDELSGSRSQRDFKPRDRRNDTPDTDELSGSQRDSKRRSDTREDGVRAGRRNEDQTASKHTTTMDEKPSDMTDKEKNAGSVDKHERNVRQRVRYKVCHLCLSFYRVCQKMAKFEVLSFI